MSTKKIIIIDDEPLIPALMKGVIEEDRDLQIAAVACAKEEFLSLIAKDHFDIAVIDISVGGREGGLDLLKTLRDKSDLPVIILSAHDEVAYALKCLQLGAKGYVCKDCICTDMVQAAKSVSQGGLYVSGRGGENILIDYLRSCSQVQHS